MGTPMIFGVLVLLASGAPLRTADARSESAGYLKEAKARLELARRTLELVERTGPRPQLAGELAVLEKRVGGAEQDGIGPAQAEGLQKIVAALRRRIIFSHPLLDFDRILFTKRPPPGLCAPGDNYFAIHNGVGPGLVFLDAWKSDNPKETVVLRGKLGPGCMMHPDLSFDGRRAVFAYSDHSRPKRERQFFLYEVGVDGRGLRRLTGGRKDPLVGAHGRRTIVIEDYDPCYLPDGGIAFVSTRSQSSVRCHEGGRYCPNYVLYRCDGDGSNIRQLSYGEAAEWDPAVMPDGQILWTRWDYVNRPVLPTMGLWTTRPDGTAAAHYFGNYMANPFKICQARPIPGTSKVVATTAAHHAMHAGCLIVIDRRVAEDGPDAIVRLTPDARHPEAEKTTPVSYSTPYPLSEDLFLCAFCPDPLPASMKHVPRTNGFGIYLLDSLGGRELIHRDPHVSCFAPMPVRARAVPPVPRSQLSRNAKCTGVFYVQDVYQSTQSLKRGTIKRLRVNELMTQPTQRVPRSSVVTFEILKRVLGTVPVEADGSAAFEAPAGVPLQFQALDENGMAVLTMRTFTQLQPGESLGCVGCHESRTSVPRARMVPRPARPRKLTPPAGPQYAGGLSFAKTIQPVLDRYCIRCHGLGGGGLSVEKRKKAQRMNLLGTIPPLSNLNRVVGSMHASKAYLSLARRPLVRVAQYRKESWSSVPKDYFAHAGRLVPMLLKGHNGVTLDPESMQRIVDWLDVNAQFYGTWSWNKDEWRQPEPPGEALLRAHIRKRFGEDLASQPYAALVNVGLVTESRILKAPLAASAGGWGQIAKNGWQTTADHGYRRMLKLVEGSIRPLRHRDIAGTCGRDGEGDCPCRSCWVRTLSPSERRLAGD